MYSYPRQPYAQPSPFDPYSFDDRYTTRRSPTNYGYSSYPGEYGPYYTVPLPQSSAAAPPPPPRPVGIYDDDYDEVVYRDRERRRRDEDAKPNSGVAVIHIHNYASTEDAGEEKQRERERDVESKFNDRSSVTDSLLLAEERETRERARRREDQFGDDVRVPPPRRSSMRQPRSPNREDARSSASRHTVSYSEEPIVVEEVRRFRSRRVRSISPPYYGPPPPPGRRSSSRSVREVERVRSLSPDERYGRPAPSARSTASRFTATSSSRRSVPGSHWPSSFSETLNSGFSRKHRKQTKAAAPIPRYFGELDDDTKRDKKPLSKHSIPKDLVEAARKVNWVWPTCIFDSCTNPSLLASNGSPKGCQKCLLQKEADGVNVRVDDEGRTQPAGAEEDWVDVDGETAVGSEDEDRSTRSSPIQKHTFYDRSNTGMRRRGPYRVHWKRRLGSVAGSSTASVSQGRSSEIDAFSGRGSYDYKLMLEKGFTSGLRELWHDALYEQGKPFAVVSSFLYTICFGPLFLWLWLFGVWAVK